MLGNLKWVALVATLAGPVFAWQGWQAKELWSHLETKGATTTGTLEAGEVKSGRRSSKSYRFEVSYTPTNGAPTKQTFEVTKEFAARATQGDQIVNDTCTVRYDPAEPTVALIVDGSKDDRSSFEIGLGMLVAGAIGSFFLFRRKAAASAPAN